MGFENARDSFNDLREMSRRQVTNKQKQQKNGGEKRTSLLFQKKAAPVVGGNSGGGGGGGSGLHGTTDSLNDLRRISYRKGPPSP
eukprot:scaffold32005_cov78-Skeletonema_dohrnii-CCMP3373.AAC.1